MPPLAGGPARWASARHRAASDNGGGPDRGAAMTRVTDRRPSGAPGSSRWWYWVPAAAAAAALLAGADPAAAAPPTPAATAGASWGRTVEVPGLAALNAGGNAQVLSVSCWRAGYCAAGSFYTRKLGSRQAFG